MFPKEGKKNMSVLTVICDELEISNFEQSTQSKIHIQGILSNFKIVIKDFTLEEKNLLLEKYKQNEKVLRSI